MIPGNLLLPELESAPTPFNRWALVYDPRSAFTYFRHQQVICTQAPTWRSVLPRFLLIWFLRYSPKASFLRLTQIQATVFSMKTRWPVHASGVTLTRSRSWAVL